jgi:hypothetical protein
VRITYRYPAGALLVEGAQGAAGFLASAGVLAFFEPALPVACLAAAAAVLFLVYFARAIVRRLTRIELDEREIRALGPLGVAVPWREMRSVRLNHYTTKSDRSGGWMQLVVRGMRGSIRIDSSLTDFPALVARAGAEAERHGAALDARTRGNFRILGIALHD